MKRQRLTPAALIALGTALSGCGANHHSIFRHETIEPKTAAVLTVDAKQRAILTSAEQSSTTTTRSDNGKTETIVNLQRRFCSEPSPDVFAVIAQAFSGSGSFGQTPDPKSVEAALDLAFSSAEQGSTIPRSQTINMLRELMFRTCERYLGGAYDADQVAIQAIRDQRLMISILAIEQLTGVVTPRPVVLAASANATAGASSEAIIRLDNARQAMEAAKADHAAKVKKYDTVKVECEPADGKITDEKKIECAALKKARDDAAILLNEKTKTYEELSQLAKSAGVTVGTTTSSDAKGGLDAVNKEATARIADSIDKIIDINGNDDTEILLYCLGALNNHVKPPASGIKEACEAFLKAKIDRNAARLNADGAKYVAEYLHSASTMQTASDRYFASFWEKRQRSFTTGPATTAFVKEITPRLTKSDKPKADCFAGKTRKDEVKACFVQLPIPLQQELVK